ncbi:MAG TPA: carbohydrate kinase family protein [Nocardioidaceae bacterium]|nr:carbohydrate kinase family protein [Nocardioidaceae bacterium]
MHTVCVGDALLDLVVAVPHGLRTDDDSEARIDVRPGGQGANVAAWLVALGGAASLVGPVCESAAGRLVADGLAASGIALLGVAAERTGTVISVSADGMRTLLTDPGDQGWVDRLEPVTLPAADCLHLSGYVVLRSSDLTTLRAWCAAARSRGATVSVDLAAATLVQRYGAERLQRALVGLRPTVVFGNAAEWDALGLDPRRAPFDAVCKRGADGVEVVWAGIAQTLAARTGPVVDTTGAGDAFAAGYLLGGPELGLTTAARCVASLGAQPPRPAS